MQCHPKALDSSGGWSTSIIFPPTFQAFVFWLMFPERFLSRVPPIQAAFLVHLELPLSERRASCSHPLRSSCCQALPAWQEERLHAQNVFWVGFWSSNTSSAGVWKPRPHYVRLNCWLTATHMDTITSTRCIKDQTIQVIRGVTFFDLLKVVGNKWCLNGDLPW